MKARGFPTRSLSAPCFLLPSLDIGKYEEVKGRRWSEPLPPRTGGLFPLSVEGTYGPPPQYEPAEPPASKATQLSSQKKKRRVKTYASYSVSRDCAVHGPGLTRSEETRREGVAGRKMSSYAGRENVENWRNSSHSWSSSSSRSSSSTRSSSESENPPVLTYQSLQYVRQKIPRPSLKSYNSFCTSLKEVLYEEDEEEQKEEQTIPFTFRYSEDPCWDSMGVLGLSSRMSRDNKNKQETFLMESGGRKESVNTHQM
eukprot:GFUD01064797.1.p1 GENE.GFUD01064797.1~~GFUD01064797.1.p1  ORF type:complete len:280 (-),score=80.27 GFUD01064797.1:28-795(-)